MPAGAVQEAAAILWAQRTTDDNCSDHIRACELKRGCRALQPCTRGVRVVDEQERETAHVGNRLEGGVSGGTVSGNARPRLQGIEHREACGGES